MTNKPKITCGDCFYGRMETNIQGEQTNSGHCYLNPPVVVPRTEIDMDRNVPVSTYSWSERPEVRRDDFCGKAVRYRDGDV